MRILAFIIALAMPSWGQDNPVVGSYRNFDGGLNNDDASLSIGPNESPNLLNVNIDDPRGALTQRKGYQSCGTIPSGNTVTNLYEYAKNDGTRRLIVTDNTTVWQTANCINFSTITTGLNSLELPRFATVLDDLWIVNGSTYPIVWNGSIATQLDGLNGRPKGPIGKYISYWKSRVWIANVPTSPSSVFFSALVDDSGNILDPETSTGAWLSTNQIYINRDDGSPIYGMKPYRDNLYVWKETGINRILFESEFNLSLAKNVSNTGSKFNESIVEMDDGLIRFLGNDGIYAFDGSRVQRLSSKISPTIESIKQQTGGQGFQLWDTADDFQAGTFNYISTYPYTGSLYVNRTSSISYLYDDFSDGDLSNPLWSYPTANCWSVVAGKAVCGGTEAQSRMSTILPSKLFAHDSAKLSASLTLGKANGTVQLVFHNSTSQNIGASDIDDAYFSQLSLVLAGGLAQEIRVSRTYYIGSSTTSSICTYKIPGFSGTQEYGVELVKDGPIYKTYLDSALVCTYNATGDTSESFPLIISTITALGNTTSPNSGSLDNVYISTAVTTGTFTSQISTFTGLTQWRTFAADNRLS